jgi:acyl-CoA synthetase (AMP-forming)/AMP-acid ligase II
VDRVGILAQTRVEWAEIDAACWLAAVVSVPVQTALLGDTVRLVFARAAVRVVFVDTPAQLEKLVDANGEVTPCITDVVLLDARVRFDAPDERGRLSLGVDEVWPRATNARLHAYDVLCALGAARRGPTDDGTRPPRSPSSSRPVVGPCGRPISPRS